MLVKNRKNCKGMSQCLVLYSDPCCLTVYPIKYELKDAIISVKDEKDEKSPGSHTMPPEIYKVSVLAPVFLIFKVKITLSGI